MAGFPGSQGPTGVAQSQFGMGGFGGPFNPWGIASSGTPQTGFTPMGNQQPSPFTGGGVNPFLEQMLRQQGQTIGGQYLNPQSNQYLQAYYNAAAQPMIEQFKFGTDPSILGGAVKSGNLFSSAPQQQESIAQGQLSRGLADLASGIFEPAYMAERQLQQQSALNAPGTAAGMYLPAQQLMNIGGQQQQQQQRYLSSPFDLLSQYSGLIPSMLGNFNVSKLTGSSGGK